MFTFRFSTSFVLQIVFDYPSEVLTHITGYYGPTMVMGPNVIQSLTFHTTKSYYGPYGEEQGQTFSSNLKEGKIVGFHGRKGLFLDAIGVHVLEGKVLPKIHSPSKAFPTVIASSVKPVPPLVSSSNQVVNPKDSPTKLSIKPVVKVTLPTDTPTKVLPTAIIPTKPSKQQSELPIRQPGSPKWSIMPGRRGASEEVLNYLIIFVCILQNLRRKQLCKYFLWNTIMFYRITHIRACNEL